MYIQYTGRFDNNLHDLDKYYESSWSSAWFYLLAYTYLFSTILVESQTFSNVILFYAFHLINLLDDNMALLLNI